MICERDFINLGIVTIVIICNTHFDVHSYGVHIIYQCISAQCVVLSVMDLLLI